MFEKKISIVQAIILGFFAVGLIGGLIIISIGGKDEQKTKKQNYGVVNIWGTIDAKKFESLKRDLVAEKNAIGQSLVYRQIDESGFEMAITNAVIEERQPQMIITTNKNINNLKRVILPIDERFLSKTTIKNDYLEAAKVFIIDNKILAMPIALDPIVLFYNKDIYSANAIINAPETWEEFKNTVSRITKKSGKSITLAGTSLGTYSNVKYANEIIFTLILQTGKNLSNKISFNNPGDRDRLRAALSIFTLFSNPSEQNKYYSWNSSKEDSMSEFLSSRVAMIFAPYSEYKKIRERNPNLNYRVSEVPHSKNSSTVYRATYADIYGISFVKGARNIKGAYAIFADMRNDNFMSKIANEMKLPSVKKSVISKSKINKIAINSAIYAKSAYFVNGEKIDSIFYDFITNVVNGRMTKHSAADFVAKEFQLLLKK